jgi:hypothetical protein
MADKPPPTVEQLERQIAKLQSRLDKAARVYHAMRSTRRDNLFDSVICGLLAGGAKPDRVAIEAERIVQSVMQLWDQRAAGVSPLDAKAREREYRKKNPLPVVGAAPTTPPPSLKEEFDKRKAQGRADAPTS